MQDRSSYSSSNNKPQISEGLQNFINAMVEEIVLKGEAFDDQKKKWLKKYSEAEGLNYIELEGNLILLFALLNDYFSTKSDAIKQVLIEKAKTCYVSENLILKAVSQKSDDNKKKTSKVISSNESKKIIATDSNIKTIVQNEIKRLGNSANLNHIDVSNVKNMEGVFEYSKFNGDISDWDVSNVKNMKSMFDGSYLKQKGKLPFWYHD